MKKMTVTAIGMAVAVLLTMTALTGTGLAKKWRSGHPAAPDSVANLTHERFIDLVAEKTDGRIQIDGYPAEQLGPYRDMFDNVVRGMQEVGFLPVSPEFSPSLQAVYTVYLADDWEQGKKIYAPDGWMFKLLEPIFSDLGVKLLGFYFIGMDGLGSTKGPVVMPKDLVEQEIKVRVWCPADRLFFQEIGAQTVDIAFSELFTSLQTGVAHAQDNTPEVSYTLLRDVTKYYTDVGHIFEPFAVMINKDLFDGLAPETQTAIQEAATEALAWGNKKSEASEEDYYRKMEEAGITVTRLTPEQRAAWKEYGRASWQEFEKVIGKDMMEYIRDHAQ
jgi:TRAP-type C4-dicarboxylate transport system substrate-binding protein